MALTELQIRKAKPVDKSVRLYDSGGLYMEVTPTGGRHWRMKYRFPKGGPANVLSIGAYPGTTLVNARKARDDARALLDAGIDPNAQKRASRKAALVNRSNTFSHVFEQWLETRCIRWGVAHRAKIKRMVERELFPSLRNGPIADITPTDLLEALDPLVKRGAINQAIRVVSIASRVFRYAIAMNLMRYNPADSVRDAFVPPAANHFTAITEAGEVEGLIKAIMGHQGSEIDQATLRLMPLLFLRPSELCGGRWSEVDLGNAIWEIPAERMKKRVPLSIPLSEQAVAILKDLHAVTGHLPLMFPSVNNPDKPINSNRLRTLLDRIGYGIGKMTAHGFRAMARTMLDEVLDIRVDYIEMQLAHKVRDVNGRAYNRTKHWSGRKDMMQRWADYLNGFNDQNGHGSRKSAGSRACKPARQHEICRKTMVNIMKDVAL